MPNAPILTACQAVVVAAAALAAAPAARAAEPTAITVYDLATDGMTGRQRHLLLRSLIRELSKTDGLELRTPDAGAAQPAARAGCPQQEPGCLVRLAAALGVAEVITGRATRLGPSRILTLKRVRMRDAITVGTATRRLTAGDGDELLRVLGDAVAELYPEHTLRTDSIRGVRPEVVERWSPSPLPQWSFWTATGLALSGAVATVSFGLLTRAAENDYDALLAEARTTPVDGARLVQLGDRAEARARWTNASLGISLGLLVTAGIMSFFTDWGSDRAIEPLLTPVGASPGAAALVRF